jgi:hypothetical protein
MDLLRDLRWLIVQLTGVTLWSLWTYPTMADLDALTELDDQERLDGLLEMRREWLDQIVAIGTGLAVTPMTALLSAVVGYLLRGMKDDAQQDAPK